jgi:hypothetical protein
MRFWSDTPIAARLSADVHHPASRLRTLATVGALVILTGCAATVPQQVTVAPPPAITCKLGPDCDAKWSRAVSWITTNSSYKIKTQTADIVQTMGPTDSSPNSAFTVTKVAQNTGGLYEITFAGGCDNWIGCIPTVSESRARFTAFVLGL